MDQEINEFKTLKERIDYELKMTYGDHKKLDYLYMLEIELDRYNDKETKDALIYVKSLIKKQERAIKKFEDKYTKNYKSSEETALNSKKRKNNVN